MVELNARIGGPDIQSCSMQEVSGLLPRAPPLATHADRPPITTVIYHEALLEFQFMTLLR